MKKLFFVSLMLVMAGFASGSDGFKNGRVIMLVNMEVTDLATWKSKFDEGAAIREKAGIKILSIGSQPDNKNKIMLLDEAENAEAAYNFSLMLKKKQAAGEIKNFDIKLYDKAE